MSLGFVLFASSLLAGGCGAGSRHEPFRAVAADNGRMAVAGRLSAIEKAGMAGPLPIPFCRQAVGKSALWHALGRLRGWPWEAPPYRASCPHGRRTPSGRDRKNVRSPGVQAEERAGCPAADRQEHLPKRREDSDVPAAGKETEKGRALAGSPLVFLSMGVALTGPERHPAGWARRVQAPRAGSVRQALPARARQAAHFPQGRACLPRAPEPRLPGPEQPVLQPEQRLQERERWFPSLPGPGRLQSEWWLQERQGPWPPQQVRLRGQEPFPGQPHQQRALPARPFRRQLRGPQERCPLRQRSGLRGQRRSGAGQRRA